MSVTFYFESQNKFGYFSPFFFCYFLALAGLLCCFGSLPFFVEPCELFLFWFYLVGADCLVGECLALSRDEDERLPFFEPTTFSGETTFESFGVCFEPRSQSSEEIELRDDSILEAFSLILDDNSLPCSSLGLLLDSSCDLSLKSADFYRLASDTLFSLTSFWLDSLSFELSCREDRSPGALDSTFVEFTLGLVCTAGVSSSLRSSDEESPLTGLIYYFYLPDSLSVF